jgi:rare lipoprotein A (peptidoglycan hydrolase)
LAPADFHPIEFGPAPSTAPDAVLERPIDPGTLAPIADFADEQPSFAPRPRPRQRNEARSVAKVLPMPKASSTGKSAQGSATWYCKTGVSACHSDYAGGYYAAAGPALRVGNWRGRVVRVCGSGSCVNVRLVDWCACGGSHIIDLYSYAFQRLAPLNAGAVRVTVSW